MRRRCRPLSSNVCWLDDDDHERGEWWSDGDLWAGQMALYGSAILPGFGAGDFPSWRVATVAETRWDDEPWACASGALWDDVRLMQARARDD